MTEEMQDSNQAYRPTERADADRKVSTQPQKVNTASTAAHRYSVSDQWLQREPRWKIGEKLRKKDSEDFFTIDVKVVKREYNEAKHEWMYKLEDYRSRPIEGMTKEGDME
ncbi:MAG: hypothetical protein LQ352_001990 [Teloschistes flavicans]|nr:MAG: hypothetical protein LQ352_001990 [Teloschistes flavicans]